MATISDGPSAASIDSCFIFPVCDGAAGTLQNVAMHDERRNPEVRFAPIHCHYAGMGAVASAYCRGQKIAALF